MKSYEKESLFKSFILFFPALMLLLSLFYYQNYLNQKELLKESILNSMKSCSVTLDCKEYSLDIVSKNKQELVKLYSNNKEIYSFFHIPKIPQYYLKLSLSKSAYKSKIDKIKKSLLKEYILYSIILATMALLFSLYSLYPLKKAINLNDEFVKDMLHDINTPLSAIKINLQILEKKFGSSSVIERLKQSLNSIEALQNNLQSFLSHSKLQVEKFDIKEVIEDRVKHFKSIYGVNINVNINNLKILANKGAFIRIIDNLIDNACKHNSKENLEINIFLIDKKLHIKDNGKGIKEIDKIFERGFTSSKRGLGLGLSIVKKLSSELHIKIELNSKVNEGAEFVLDLSPTNILFSNFNEKKKV